MGHVGKFLRSRWRLPWSLGAAVLTAGMVAAALPAGEALASTPPQYTFEVTTSVAALGHTWNVLLLDGGGAAWVSLGTTYKGVSEEYEWTSTAAFAPLAAKELKVTSTGHATYSTGTALSPVLAVSLTFTPTKATKSKCTSGSDTSYAGKVTGSLTLNTGLRAGKVKVKFSGQLAGWLDVDKSCVSPPPPPPPPGKTYCSGANWSIAATSSTGGQASGYEYLGSKTTWSDEMSRSGVATASKYLTRSDGVGVNGPAPKLNTKAKTVTFSGLTSGAITGTAVMSYRSPLNLGTTTCYVGTRKYKETTTMYSATSVKMPKPLQGHTVMAGTITMKPATWGIYDGIKLVAA